MENVEAEFKIHNLTEYFIVPRNNISPANVDQFMQWVSPQNNPQPALVEQEEEEELSEDEDSGSSEEERGDSTLEH